MWEFGLTELIQTIATAATLLTVGVSLYLATKSKTVKYRLYRKKIDIKELKENSFQKVMLLNTGHIKFTVTRIGYYINKKYYSCLLNNFLKKLDEPRIETDKFGNKKRTTAEIETDISTYLKEGDCIEFYLYPKTFNFIDSGKNKKVYYFIMVNDKIKKIYTGLREKDFYELLKSEKRIAEHLHKYKGDQDPKTKSELFFRC